VLPCRIWSFCVKGCGRKYRRTLETGKGCNSTLGMGGMTDPKIQALPHMHYHIKFGSCATKGVCINRREPPKLVSAGAPPPWGGAWLTPKNKPLTICVTRNIYMWPRPRRLGLGLGLSLVVLALTSASASEFWPRPWRFGLV